MSIDPIDTDLQALKQQALAGDIGGIRESYELGELQWLRNRMTPERYAHLGLSLSRGDLESVRSDLATVKSPIGTTPLIVDDGARRSLFLQSQRNGLIAGAIIAALALLGLIAFLALRNNDNASDTTVAMSVAETAPDTTTPDTITPTTIAPTTITPTTITGNSSLPQSIVPPSTASAASSPTTQAAQAPVVTASPGATAPAASPAPPITTTGALKSDVLTTAERSSTFSSFLAMIDAAGLREEVQTLNPTTVLAPTESAFSSLSGEVRAGLRSPANKAILARIVRYNVIPQAITLRQFTTSDLKSLEGSALNVVVGNNKVVINDATVTGADVLTTTGVFHAIDKLLLPPGVSLNALVAKPVPSATVPPQTNPPSTQPLATNAPATQPPATSPATTQVLPAVVSTTIASTTTKVP